MSFPDSDRPESAQETILNQAPELQLPNRAVVLRERYTHTQAAALPSVLSTTPNIAGLLFALRRRWRLAFFLGLVLGIGAAAGMWFSQPIRFTARTLVLDDPTKGINPLARDHGSYQRTQIAYIRSRLVLNAALSDPRVLQRSIVHDQVDPLLWLEKQIQVDFAVAPEILRIQLTGDDQEELKAIVNAVRDSYFKEVHSREMRSREERLKLLKEIFAEAERSLSDKRKNLRQLSEDVGSTKDAKAMERMQQVYTRMLDNLQGELVQTHTKLQKAKMEFEIHQRREGQPGAVKPQPNLIELAIKEDKEVNDYLKRIAKFDNDLEQLKKNLLRPESDPLFKSTTSARDVAQKELGTLQQRLRQNFAKELRDKINLDKNSPHMSYQDEITILEAQYNWLDEELKKSLSSLKDINRIRFDVETLRDEIKLEDDLSRRMASQSQNLQIEMRAPDRFTVLEEAYVTPDLDGRLKKAGMAGGGTFAFILFAIAFLEFRSRRVSNVDEVVRGLKMRFVGSLPPLPSRARTRAQTKSGNAHWQNQMAESIETTRTVLLHAAESEALRLIVVTSAVGGEGKTLTSSHLAASLARAGRRTLLIDADLRRPALQRIFNLAIQPGLSELLRGEVDTSAAVQAGPIAGLSIIAAGNSDDRSIQALSQPILTQLFKKFRDEFDFVIIDSAPILPVADTQMICQQADGVIFAVLRDVSRLPKIYAAHERLASLRIRILGAVVNGTVGPAYGSSYSYSTQNRPAATA